VIVDIGQVAANAFPSDQRVRRGSMLQIRGAAPGLDGSLRIATNHHNRLTLWSDGLRRRRKSLIVDIGQVAGNATPSDQRVRRGLLRQIRRAPPSLDDLLRIATSHHNRLTLWSDGLRRRRKSLIVDIG